MPDRADKLLTAMWRRATREIHQPEGFLEDALAAVLEEPAIWERLVDHLGWGQVVPRDPPRVSTQDIVLDGRTDIRLTWPDALPLVLELKVTDAPSVAQVSTYLATGVRVAAVATYPALLRVAPEHMGHFLGVITWRRIRDLDWPVAPLILRQLHHLGLVKKQLPALCAVPYATAHDRCTMRAGRYAK